MDRLFLDANILFSAAYRPDAGLQRLWTLPDAELITSTYAIEEARTNLQSQEQLSRLDCLLATATVISNWSHITLPDTIILPEKDVPIMQAAIAADATHLITGDARDFGAYFGKIIAGVEILRPADYLRSA